MKVFRYFMLWFAFVPFLAVILETLNEKFSFGEIEVPFHWELIWIASVLFLIAWIIYIFCCPMFIKKYPTYNDYLSHGHDPRWIVWESKEIVKKEVLFEKFFLRLNKKNLLSKEESFEELHSPMVEENQTKIYFKKGDEVYSLGMPRIIDSTFDKEATKKAEEIIFWEVYGRFSSSKPLIRGIILFLFSISILLVAYTVFENICSGVKHITK